VREMNVGDFGVMLSGAAMVVLVAVVLVELRCWRIRRATGRVGRRLEEITALVEESQRRHGTRMRGLQRRLELAERAVGRAEDMAYRSVSSMRTLRDDVGPRLLAAERSVGLRDVVVDLDANGKGNGNGAAGQGDQNDERPGGDGDDDRPEREPQPAGQAGSS
jgi:hypothetical protein